MQFLAELMIYNGKPLIYCRFSAIIHKRSVSHMKEKRNKGDIFISLWNAFCIIVILGFFVFSMIIGGSAGLGYQENGRFFVRDHAEVVEVSKILWEISNIWGILFWIFIPLTPIGAFVISNIQEKIEQRKNRFE